LISRTAQEDYDELALYTLAHRSPAFIHQHIVDAFAAQTASERTKPIALTFALVGLYLHVELGVTGKNVQRAHMRMGRFKKQWPAFVLPEERGSITVADVRNAPPGPERDRAIDDWCASVWRAYAASRQQIIDLVRQELG